MKAHGWYKKEWERARDTFAYKLEGLELEVTEKILQIMEEEGISRSELANRLKVSKAAVSKLLNNGSNLTLKRLLAITDALDYELRVNLMPAGRQTEDKVVHYNPKARTQGPKFSLDGFIGADDYVLEKEVMLHAINEC